jgi:hypothetical protein
MSEVATNLEQLTLNLSRQIQKTSKKLKHHSKQTMLIHKQQKPILKKKPEVVAPSSSQQDQNYKSLPRMAKFIEFTDIKRMPELDERPMTAPVEQQPEVSLTPILSSTHTSYTTKSTDNMRTVVNTLDMINVNTRVLTSGTSPSRAKIPIDTSFVNRNASPAIKKHLQISDHVEQRFIEATDESTDTPSKNDDKAATFVSTDNKIDDVVTKTAAIMDLSDEENEGNRKGVARNDEDRIETAAELLRAQSPQSVSLEDLVGNFGCADEEEEDGEELDMVKAGSSDSLANMESFQNIVDTNEENLNEALVDENASLATISPEVNEESSVVKELEESTAENSPEITSQESNERKGSQDSDAAKISLDKHKNSIGSSFSETTTDDTVVEKIAETKNLSIEDANSSIVNNGELSKLEEAENLKIEETITFAYNTLEEEEQKIEEAEQAKKREEVVVEETDKAEIKEEVAVEEVKTEQVVEAIVEEIGAKLEEQVAEKAVSEEEEEALPEPPSPEALLAVEKVENNQENIDVVENPKEEAKEVNEVKESEDEVVIAIEAEQVDTSNMPTASNEVEIVNDVKMILTTSLSTTSVITSVTTITTTSAYEDDL